MMIPRDPDRVMIQIQQWWSRSRDDPDWVMIQIQSSDVDPNQEMILIQWWCFMLIQIERWSRSNDDVLCWSRSRDDPDPVMMFYVDPDREMIQIQWWCSMMIQIERWSRSEADLKTKMTWRWDDPADTEKKTSAKNCVERIPSYLRGSVDVYVTSECILLYILYYCNPMFIPGCFYYVFESYGHAPMFRSGGL